MARARRRINAAAVMKARRMMTNQSKLRRQGADLGDPRAELLGDRQSAQEGGGLFEFFDHVVDGALAIAVHDHVERMEEVLLGGLVRAVADELLGHCADA